MAEVELPADTFKFSAEPGAFPRNPLPGERIPVYVRPDGSVTLDKNQSIEGMAEIGYLASVADDGPIVRVWRRVVSVDLADTLDDRKQITFRNV